MDPKLMGRALRAVVAAIPSNPLGLVDWATALPVPSGASGPELEGWLAVLLEEFPPGCEEPASAGVMVWIGTVLEAPAYIHHVKEVPGATTRLGTLLQSLMKKKLTDSCAQLLSDSLTAFATAAPGAVDALWGVLRACLASPAAPLRRIADALLQSLEWGQATFHQTPDGLTQLWGCLMDGATQREVALLLPRLSWGFLAEVGADEALASERACHFLRLVGTLHLLPNAPEGRAFLKAVPAPPVPPGQQPFDAETTADGNISPLTHTLWLYIRPQHFLECFDGTVCAKALSHGLLNGGNARKLLTTLHTLCVIAHRLRDRRVAAQVVLECRGVMFTIAVDSQHHHWHLPLADHLTVLQSVLLPLAVQHGADCPPILGTVLWCLSNTDPGVFVRNQVQTTAPLGPGAAKGDLQVLCQGPDYVQTYTTIRSLVFRFCASSGEALARQLLNTAALLVPDVLLACEVLERALEAFLRGCRPHARGCTVAAATLSLPPQYSAPDFLHLCRDRQCNLLVLALLRQMLPEPYRPTEEAVANKRPTGGPVFTLTDEEDTDAPVAEARSSSTTSSGSAPSERSAKVLLHVVDEALLVKPNLEREWDILAVYCLVAEALSDPKWDLQQKQIQAKTLAVLDALSMLAGSPARLMDRLAMGLKKHALAAHRFPKEFVFAAAALEIYTLQVVRRQVVFLPKSMAERVADSAIGKKVTELEQHNFDLSLCQPVIRQLQATAAPQPEDLPRLIAHIQKILGAGCLLHKV